MYFVCFRGGGFVKTRNTGERSYEFLLTYVEFYEFLFRGKRQNKKPPTNSTSCRHKLLGSRIDKPKQYHPTNNETKVDNHSNSPTKSMHCYFNISIAGSPSRRVVFRLYSDKCP